MEITVVFLKSSAGLGEILTRIVVENYGFGGGAVWGGICRETHEQLNSDPLWCPLNSAHLGLIKGEG